MRRSVKYFTHQKSYYPVPELAMDLSTIAKLNPILYSGINGQGNYSNDGKMASKHGQCV